MPRNVNYLQRQALLLSPEQDLLRLPEKGTAARTGDLSKRLPMCLCGLTHDSPSGVGGSVYMLEILPLFQGNSCVCKDEGPSKSTGWAAIENHGPASEGGVHHQRFAMTTCSKSLALEEQG